MHGVTLALVIAFAAFAAAEYSSSDDVVILTEDNFDSVIEDNKYVLAEFYAPWCGHCKSLEPHYKKAATALKESGVKLAALDATAHSEPASRFDVKGYPTLKFFIDGKPTEYTGGRTSDTIVAWINKRTGPAAKELSVSEVADFAASANVVIVGFFASKEDAAFKTFESVAQGIDEFPFGVAFGEEAAAANGVTGAGIVLFKKFDEGKNILDDDEFTAEAVAHFISSNSLPLVIPFTMEVAGKIFQSPIGAIALLFSNSPFDEFKSIAEKFKGKFVFTTSDDTFDRLNGYIGVEPKNFPLFYILKTEGQLVKFPLEGAPDATSVTAHIEAYLAGSLKASFKSEPIPEDNDEPVTVIVGKNFESIVLDETKDVLLEIYAPWCGHCKTLAPIWEKLGAHYKDNENIVIAKMDGTANEVDGIEIKGFPTLKWYPAGAKTAKSAKAYDGGRDLEAFQSFIDKNAKSTASSGKDEL